jgi:putative addiction module killer protein
MIKVLRSETFIRWLSRLKDIQARSRIADRIDRLQQGNLGDSKAVGGGVFELRLAFGPGYRIYFMRQGVEIVILLCGGDKSTQTSDIRKAIQMAEDYSKRGVE